MAYYLKKYIPAESNYEIYDKEFISKLYVVLKVWDAELRSISKGFDIITDHKNIEYFIKKTAIKRAVNAMVLGINPVWLLS